jgi:outer membrane protein assembly factor BamB
LFLVAAGCGLSALTAGAADWPQWRGPHRNGISQETGLLKEWPKEGPKLLWQVNDIGYGYGAPAIVGDRLYLVGNRGLEEEFVEALAVKDGKRIWSRRLGKVGKPQQRPNFPAARSTPTVDGNLVYALSSDGDLACLEAADGKERWHKNLQSEFGGKSGLWAYSESPLIDGDVLICTPGGSEVTLLALNKKTGEVLWKSAVPGGDSAGYASAQAVEVGGHKEYVQFLGKGLVGVDAKTGKVLWRYGKTAGMAGMSIQTPVFHADYVYSAGARAGGGLVHLKGDKEGVAAEQVYFDRGLPNSIGGAVLVDGYLYGTTGEGLVCAKFVSGKVAWQDKCVGPGSVCFADGRLYVHGENGEMALVEATPEAYHEKGRFTPPNPPKHLRGGMERAWAYPAIANGQLYIRDVGTLWCYDIKSPGAGR